ncbi:hypothetical protein HRR83_006239 [Exophiala dermatitidis]|uniref:Uncharacterized protein n=2 Tax=Exophiala dermatitidis TaxID=5970 RepID=H6C1J2_EXODN|nr:uncharacterized protein HMPREF1120_06590 [Exophiala dermatitidis NIH/UT8656]XP_009159043.1 hypothetical protein, variant [Exophiala dermatitidis NIH/UT8656]KAJ4507268.1 hypothetical protein HRR75_006617 [Exophiala dermatitidis]EHY58581.1 hypothetical protein, variant [Exophiala dermatitidis NIH/UT8656]EHY58582.1 hypothetical protein HMPREF1120_06590 [Exophiala dermatitidis NIH/UT8656]KAJ4509244.1 hypothetical protein HRR73_007098 [Exophiala dermatitidis]KAJ4509431.1 hypothetical protein HR
MSESRPAPHYAAARAVGVDSAPNVASGSQYNHGKNKSSGSKPAASTTQSTPGFFEGNSVLTSYGLGLSGRRERILSSPNVDKFFDLVEQCWVQLSQLKPHLNERFSFAEFRHSMALALYQRIENVKFDALGITPCTPVRIPLPNSTRLFQPIWSVLANIGIVEDDELRVTYIPNSWLPDTDRLSSDGDLDGLLDGCLYRWQNSWDDVLKARRDRRPFQSNTPADANETTDLLSGPQHVAETYRLRRPVLPNPQQNKDSGKCEILDRYLYLYPAKNESGAGESDVTLINASPEHSFVPELSYRLSDGTTTVQADARTYGARLHWDPQLWRDYEQFVEIVTPVAMFSLSTPAESSGTYAWLLPVKEHRDRSTHSGVSVSARLPRASIAPATWMLSFLLQSSNLEGSQQSTFTAETDRLSDVNVIDLRNRYICSAIRDPSATVPSSSTRSQSLRF